MGIWQYVELIRNLGLAFMAVYFAFGAGIVLRYWKSKKDGVFCIGTVGELLSREECYQQSLLKPRRVGDKHTYSLTLHYEGRDMVKELPVLVPAGAEPTKRAGESIEIFYNEDTGVMTGVEEQKKGIRKYGIRFVIAAAATVMSHLALMLWA